LCWTSFKCSQEFEKEKEITAIKDGLAIADPGTT
jgi:hypothetical protein